MNVQAESSNVTESQNTFDPVSASQSVLSTLKNASEDGELARRVDIRSLTAIREAGLSRMLAPKNIGGLELSPSAHIQSCITLAHGCSSASWVHMVCGAHTFMAGRYSQQCQEEIFDGNPDALLPGTLAPQGVARKADGGWVLNGRWQFGSGVDHGTWLLIGAQCVDKDGKSPLQPVHIFVRKSDMEVDDTWHTLGMRGTGSKDLLANEVFIPAHMAMPTIELFNGTFEGDVSPLYRLPVAAGLAAMLSGTVLGMTQRGVGEFIDMTKLRDDVYVGGSKANKAGIQLRVAEAKGEIDLAAMLAEKNCQIFDEALIGNTPIMDLEQKAQIRWNASYIVELCRRATERVYAVAGAHSIYNKSSLQRLHRDVNTASHHAIVDFDGIAEVRGRLALGLDAGKFKV